MKRLLPFTTLALLLGAQSASVKDMEYGRWWLTATERDKTTYIMGFSDGFSHAANLLSLLERPDLIHAYSSCLDSTSTSDFSHAITGYIRAHGEAHGTYRMLAVAEALTALCASQKKK